MVDILNTHLESYHHVTLPGCVSYCIFVHLFVSNLEIQQGLVLQQGYILEYLVVNRIIIKQVLFK